MPEDYLEDGLLMCGRCHTKKQLRLELLGELWTVGCMCRCEAEKYQASVQAEKIRGELETASRKEKWLRDAGVWLEVNPAHTFANDDGREERPSDIARRFTEEFGAFAKEQIGLMFYGGVGNGKTFLAHAVANRLRENRQTVLMSNLRAIVNAMGKDFGEDRGWLLRQIESVPLLILDDFGAERVTEYMLEQVFEVIDTRYQSKKPLLVTTNLTPKVMLEAEGLTQQRIYQRVLEMCVPVEFKGESRRVGEAKRKMAVAKSLLEGK